MRDWVTNVRSTHYLLGSVLGPHPYPLMVRDFQSVIGREARAQILERTGGCPTGCVACVGGGSNAIGLFSRLPRRPQRGAWSASRRAGAGIASGRARARASRASRRGRRRAARHAARYLLQDEDGQVLPTHSVSAGLDYPARRAGARAAPRRGPRRYDSVRDAEALAAFHLLGGPRASCRRSSPRTPSPGWCASGRRSPAQRVLLNLSGRGDKDLSIVEKEKDA